jgi:transposase-like protein
LRAPTSVTSDGAPGLIKAIESVFSSSIRIRCWFHRMVNPRSKIPEEAAPEFLAEVRAIRDAPNLEAARAQVHRVRTRFARELPSAIACLEDDLEPLLAIHHLPVRHRLACRTTNLIERSFEEERRRSKVIPRFSDERSAMKLVFVTLFRCAQRWNRVSVTISRGGSSHNCVKSSVSIHRPQDRARKEHAGARELPHEMRPLHLQEPEDLTPRRCSMFKEVSVV